MGTSDGTILHIIIDQESGIHCWIDFDYDNRLKENIFGHDLFGLGCENTAQLLTDLENCHCDSDSNGFILSDFP